MISLAGVERGRKCFGPDPERTFSSCAATEPARVLSSGTLGLLRALEERASNRGFASSGTGEIPHRRQPLAPPQVFQLPVNSLPVTFIPKALLREMPGPSQGASGNGSPFVSKQKELARFWGGGVPGEMAHVFGYLEARFRGALGIFLLPRHPLCHT